MPHLRGPNFDELLRTLLLLHLGCLETDFCTDTEVGNYIEDDFL